MQQFAQAAAPALSAIYCAMHPSGAQRDTDIICGSRLARAIAAYPFQRPGISRDTDVFEQNDCALRALERMHYRHSDFSLAPLLPVVSPCRAGISIGVSQAYKITAKVF